MKSKIKIYDTENAPNTIDYVKIYKKAYSRIKTGISMGVEWDGERRAHITKATVSAEAGKTQRS